MISPATMARPTATVANTADKERYTKQKESLLEMAEDRASNTALLERPNDHQSLPNQEMQIPKRPTMDRDEVLKSRKKYWKIRRIQDVILCIIALIVLWPLMLLTALAVVIDTPGAGPIFVQDRVGRDGKVFKFYKFRSMIPNAEKQLEGLMKKNEMTGPVFKIKDDPRITKVGKFIRKTSIDELPQIFNVLKGDMSIVGPRPALPREVAQYSEYEKQRLYVTPGLTCYWQIQRDNAF